MNLNIHNLIKTYGEQTVLHNVSVDIKDIHVLVLIGPSGGGKSTLLKILSGLVLPDSGEITLNDEHFVFTEEWLHDYRKTISVVFQSFNLFPHLSAFQNVTLPLEVVHAISKDKAESTATELLTKFSLAEHMHKKPYELSGGQQQRVAIARAMGIQPQCLMFDEPTSALDPSLTLEVLDVISNLKDNKTNIIMVTHELAFAEKIADYILYISHGEVVEHGPTKDLFNEPKTQELKDFLKTII